MGGITERELLNEILRRQEYNAITLKENAKRQLDFATKVSISMNEQSAQINKIRGYLETDPTTNQKGYIERVSSLEQELMKVKKQAAFIGGGIAVIITVGKWLLTKIF